MDRKVVDARIPVSDPEPLTWPELREERAVLLVLERETHHVPGLLNQGTFVRRVLVQQRTKLTLAGTSQILRYLLGRGFAYRKPGGWWRITELGAIVARRCRVGADKHQAFLEKDYNARATGGAR